MLNSRRVPNPFALMMHPEIVLQAMERSERLAHLQRRICRPLDKPAPTTSNAGRAQVDREIESMGHEPSALAE